jgi:hypothetical protein
MDEEGLNLQTPMELLTKGYHFMEVIHSAGLLGRWKIFKGNEPRMVLLTKLFDCPADRFQIHHSPSLVITPSLSESSSSE